MKNTEVKFLSIFDVLTLIGGLCLFLFGMDIMGKALERRAGNGLRAILGKLTQSRIAGFFTGLAVTAIIQSSSATTVMVVGFVNSGLMSLKQSIGVIMGANIGTTVTAWILSLGGISSSNVFVKLLKPTSFTPVLALIGIILLMFGKTSKKKDTATIFLGFATLMYGMDTMSGAVSGLADVPAFQNLFIMFRNPIIGAVVGALLTAILQSSSASVGILQALSITGQVSYGAAIPIIMGQNIGTCVTALLSSFGTNKNAKRAAIVHLSFNVIGTVVWLSVFSGISILVQPVILQHSATYLGIAICHTLFYLLCTILLFPASSILEKIAIKLVQDKGNNDIIETLDERLLGTPSIALQRCKALVVEMAEASVDGFEKAITLLNEFEANVADEVRELEDKVDKLEDVLGTYLVKLSEYQLTDQESSEVTMFLKAIGDFERISDHSVNIVESAEELHDKDIAFTPAAISELNRLTEAVSEILFIAKDTFVVNSVELARKIEPLEEVIDELKKRMRDSHIARLKEGKCSIEAGFVWADLLTSFERASDHCSNVGLCVIDSAAHNMNIHESLQNIKKEGSNYREIYAEYVSKYLN